MNALVLQHIACEPPGVYEDVMREQGIAIHRIELDEGDVLPDRHEFDLIVAMGGPMSVNDEARLPWLRDEKRLIAEAVRGGVPFFGACLGAQLLAASLGARVYQGPTPEVGLLAVRLTDEALEDPVFESLPPDLLTFQWHGDTFDLPDGATLLASSPAYPNQAFRWGEVAYGVQFHLEVSAAMAGEWAEVPSYAEALERVLGPGAAGDMLAELERRAEDVRAHGRVVFERWLEHVIAARMTGAPPSAAELRR
jgi:GMP synthase (glutamine-hydrolysing)